MIYAMGTVFALTNGQAVAEVTAVGAHLRRYQVSGRDVVVPFEGMPPAGHGAILAPWPNRLAGGAYQWDGLEHQVPISEPERDNALHGLMQWQRWSGVQREGNEVRLTLESVPTPGYPFQLLAETTYRLDAAGHLQVVFSVTNIGQAAAPYGCGFHPWLSPGPGPLAQAELQIDAGTWISTDERLLPTGEQPVPAEKDFTTARAVGSSDLDDAFGQPAFGPDGRSWVRLTGTDGATAAIWMEAPLAYWQVCTGDHVADPAARRSGLAAEPMTCLANAFRTRDHLVRLEPEQTHVVTWGMQLD